MSDLHEYFNKTYVKKNKVDKIDKICIKFPNTYHVIIDMKKTQSYISSNVSYIKYNRDIKIYKFEIRVKSI